MNFLLRRIPVAALVAVALSYSAVADAASRSVEAVRTDVRKVTIVEVSGSRRELFERRDKFTCAWFTARLDSSSNNYVYTAAGESARQTKTLQIQNFQRNFGRDLSFD